jgi:tripartite-type tricarboxylate transporter receptor subunit TctC
MSRQFLNVVVQLPIALLIAANVNIARAEFPDKPIRFIVPFAPGGGSDFVGRLLATKTGTGFGQQVIVDNRPGAGGLVGTQIAARTAGDGYSLLLVDTPFTVNVSLYRNANYDAVKDFTPVTLVATVPLVLVVNPSLKASTVKDFIALAKGAKGQLGMASGGAGGVAHLAGALFTMVTGAQFSHVPYKGIGPGLTAVAANEVPFMFATSQAAEPLIHSGRVRALAVTSSARSKAMPDVPTMAEAGVASYEITNWYGVVASANTPAAVVKRLHAEFTSTVRKADVVERFAKVGLTPVVSRTPEEFAAFVRSEVAKWAKVVKASGMKVE